MTIEEAITHTKNKGGMKVDFGGVTSRIVRGRGPVGRADKYMLEEMSKHYDMARVAWLTGDLETVAEFFGLYL